LEQLNISSQTEVPGKSKKREGQKRVLWRKQLPSPAVKLRGKIGRSEKKEERDRGATLLRHKAKSKTGVGSKTAREKKKRGMRKDK